MAGYRRNVTPGEIAIAMMARRFAACALELQTPYGICSADLLQTLAFTVAPPRRVGLDKNANP